MTSEAQEIPRDDSGASQQAKKSGVRTAVVWVACFLIMSLRTAFLIKRSYIDGSLAGPIPYDDISYFCDALSRLNMLRAEGVWHFIYNLGVDPPHAVTSTLVAMLGFALTGNAPFAPYLIDAIIVGAILILIVTLSELPPLASIGIFSVIVFTPLVDLAVMSFRPDFNLGLLVAITAAYIIFAKPSQETPRRAIVLGAFGAACFLTKPTAFPAVAALLIFASALLMAKQLVRNRDEEPLRFRLTKILLFCSIFISTSIIIFMVYLIFAWTEITTYIKMVMISRQDVFGRHLSTIENALFYLRLDFEMMGIAIIPVSILTAYLVLRKDIENITSLVFYFVFVILTYVIITIPNVKLFFFGGILYGSTLVFLTSALCVFANFCINKSRLLAYGVITTVLTINILNYSDTQPKNDYRFITTSNLILNQVNDVIAGDLNGNREAVKILVMYPYPVPDRDYIFNILRNGSKATSLEDFYINNDLKHWQSLASLADYSIVPDAGIVERFPIPLPILGIAPRMSAFMKTASDEFLLKDIATPDGHVYVYRRKKAVPRNDQR